ncbi:family 47 glycoside hydrolase [Cryphonectria parasitica EP155]|uniref:alpha-1,2-Mannosidase n=1 Tax=Cryphonectria parasitica (strain ATCC 38755 / EP155) TaxID=660469 RepID=A0A9P4Y276_CRYP1|nr:family 47 glycoside hydrolase [Cryphonectria parasitica EP155]KAF3765256.1 family 47 glycoside hydrolase [Cryphonectria parasitica EP155]
MAVLKSHRRQLRVALVTVSLVIAFLFTFSPYHLEHSLHRIRPSYVPSSYDWSRRKQAHPVEKYETLPKGHPKPLHRIQHTFAPGTGRAQESRRSEVKKTFRKCWASYQKYAWGRDELQPLALSGSDTFSGWGATLVDALDTLILMDLKPELAHALTHVAAIDWDSTGPGQETCSLFETTIRYLGGLLGAYDLSNETVLLRKAVELGDMLYSGFDTPNRLPANLFHFQKAKDGELIPSAREISANVGSLSLEFTRLTQLTGDPKYFDAIDRVKKRLYATQDQTKLPGLWPQYMDVVSGLLMGDGTFTLGSMEDSLYEYLPKMYMLLGGLDQTYRDMYERAMTTAKKYLLYRPMLPDEDVDILFAGSAMSNGQGTVDLMAQTQHLACFVGGMFALGGRLFNLPGDIETSRKLTRGCAWAYRVMPTNVMPEELRFMPCRTTNLEKCAWDEERWKKEGSARYPKGVAAVYIKNYLLRPEAVESLFYLWRITGEEVWRDTAWEMFLAIQKVTSTEHANSAIRDATQSGGGGMLDKMESFWMAETLKYFYLIFSETDLVSLDDYVFNTEAHPFILPKP